MPINYHTKCYCGTLENRYSLAFIRKTTRFNELLRLIPGISKGILTKQLRKLEDDGLIERTVYREVPPKVEYALSEAGKQFLPVLDAMRIWGQKRMKELTIIE